MSYMSRAGVGEQNSRKDLLSPILPPGTLPREVICHSVENKGNVAVRKRCEK